MDAQAHFCPIYPYFRFDGYTDKPVGSRGRWSSWRTTISESDPPGNRRQDLDGHRESDRQVVHLRQPRRQVPRPCAAGTVDQRRHRAKLRHHRAHANFATPVDYDSHQRRRQRQLHPRGASTSSPAPPGGWKSTCRKTRRTSPPVVLAQRHAVGAALLHVDERGIKAAGNLEFIYPGTHYLGHDGESPTGPTGNTAKDISRYDNNNSAATSRIMSSADTPISSGPTGTTRTSAWCIRAHDDKPGKRSGSGGFPAGNDLENGC